MKNEIHPKLNKVVFTDMSSGHEFLAESTIKSDKKKTIDGVEYYVIPVELTSASHPFYTGKHKIVDTENLVKKFENKSKKAEKVSDRLKAAKDKKNSRKSNKVTSISQENTLTLKDMLKQIK